MNRAERRFRTQKIAKKRFRQLYCNYHGTPEAWFFLRYDEIKRTKKKGMCKRHRDSWRCRCSYCLGGSLLKQSIADQNFLEQMQETNLPLPSVLDPSSVGIYDADHELWQLDVCPWKSCWRNAFHHPKIQIKEH